MTIHDARIDGRIAPLGLGVGMCVGRDEEEQGWTSASTEKPARRSQHGEEGYILEA